jgi:hypothetical protein
MCSDVEAHSERPKTTLAIYTTHNAFQQHGNGLLLIWPSRIDAKGAGRRMSR